MDISNFAHVKKIIHLIIRVLVQYPEIKPRCPTSCLRVVHFRVSTETYCVCEQKKKAVTYACSTNAHRAAQTFVQRPLNEQLNRARDEKKKAVTHRSPSGSTEPETSTGSLEFAPAVPSSGFDLQQVRTRAHSLLHASSSRTQTHKHHFFPSLTKPPPLAPPPFSHTF